MPSARPSTRSGGAAIGRGKHVTGGKAQPFGLGPAVVVPLVVLAIVAGVLFDRFVLLRMTAGLWRVGPTVTEEQLDRPMASYTLDGAQQQVSVRDALCYMGSLDQARLADGTYRSPSVEDALAVARSRILVSHAEKLGLVATDEDMAVYAQEEFGTSDLAVIASEFGMDEETATALMREAALMGVLRNAAVGEGPGSLPAEPEQPDPGEEVSRLPKYASYVLGLAGEEWDEAAGGWASPDGRYAQALADYEVTADGATYEAAMQAYYVACQVHVEQEASWNAAWTDYVNELLGASGFEVSTLGL